MRQKVRFYILVVVLFPAWQLAAQSAGNNPQRQLQWLLQLQGMWESPQTTMQAGGKQYSFVYSADFKAAADGSALVMNEWCSIPDVGRLSGANLIGIDPQDGKIHWYTVDNMGTTHEHTGEFSDEHHFTMVYKGLRDNKAFKETVTFEFIGQNQLNFNLVASLDNKEETRIAGIFQRTHESGK